MFQRTWLQWSLHNKKCQIKHRCFWALHTWSQLKWLLTDTWLMYTSQTDINGKYAYIILSYIRIVSAACHAMCLDVILNGNTLSERLFSSYQSKKRILFYPLFLLLIIILCFFILLYAIRSEISRVSIWATIQCFIQRYFLQRYFILA